MGGDRGPITPVRDRSHSASTWRSPRRSRDRQDSVGIPDLGRHHRAAGHLGAKRQAIRDCHQRCDGPLRDACGRSQSRQRSRRRESVDFQVVRGVFGAAARGVGRLKPVECCAVGACRMSKSDALAVQVVLALVSIASIAHADTEAAKVGAGATIYGDYCSSCHGEQLRNTSGGVTFDLRRLRAEDRDRFVTATSMASSKCRPGAASSTWRRSTQSGPIFAPPWTVDRRSSSLPRPAQVIKMLADAIDTTRPTSRARQEMEFGVFDHLALRRSVDSERGTGERRKPAQAASGSRTPKKAG